MKPIASISSAFKKWTSFSQSENTSNVYEHKLLWKLKDTTIYFCFDWNDLSCARHIIYINASKYAIFSRI